MALHRFNSVGSSAPRITKPSHLVALRYEETVQAEPPIMLPKRSSTAHLGRSRSTRSLATNATTATTASSVWSSSSRLSSTATSASTPASPTVTCSESTPAPSPSLSMPASPCPPSHPPVPSSPARYPLVILRPPGLAAPPTEQHPALRAPTFRPIVEEGGEASDDAGNKEAKTPCKRDSILASATASTVTLWPGYDMEEEDGFAGCICRSTSKKSRAAVSEAPLAEKPTPSANMPVVSASQTAPPPVPTHAKARTVGAEANEETPAAGSNETPIGVEAATLAVATAAMNSRSTKSASPKSPLAREKSWRLPKTFSFRAGSFQRRKTSKSLDSAASAPSSDGVANHAECYEDGLVPMGHTAAHENEDDQDARRRPRPAAAVLPPLTAPHLPAGPLGGHEAPKPAKLSKPNPSWPPILVAPHFRTHAPSTKANTTTARAPATSRATTQPTASAPIFSVSSSSPPPSSPSSLPPSLPAAPSTPTPFFLRVLSMSDSRQKRLAQDDGGGNGDRTDVLSPIIKTTIPTERLIEDEFLQSLTFSKRGSLMFGGKRAVSAAAAVAAFSASPCNEGSATGMPAMDAAEAPAAVTPPSYLPPLPPAVERESLQVRSLYVSSDSGVRGLNWEDGRPPSIAVASDPIAEEAEPEGEEEQKPDAEAPSIAHTLNGRLAVLGEGRRRAMNESAVSLSLPPDVTSLSISADLLQPDPATTAAIRTSIISATSAASVSTGIALTETESSLSLVTPMPADPSPQVAPSREIALARGVGRNSSPAASLAARRNEFELAGGIEDWEDVDVADVDRFGFIHVRQRPHTSASSAASLPTAGQDGKSGGIAAGLHHRFSRRHRSSPARKISTRSVHTSRSTSTAATAAAAARSSIRAAANQLPHNKDRRWIDEAGDMLTLEPGLADIAEDDDAERLADTLKRKEWERSEKWRGMAKIVRKGESAGAGGAGGVVKDGGGMDFAFDPHHPKLVERTWKGIPDRWRAPAWYSFLASSAQRRRAQRAGAPPASAVTEPATVIDGGETEEQIIAAFHRLQQMGSPDDVQIDLDVPRTVNSHVMFRKRYRGGQRLLFRVLHALSLYFPATGYVQGMASLAATLLCYYDEDRCFVMLVRLFHLRGLERLYEPGFGGLMEALGEFEQQWLARNNRRVAQKLAQLSIDAATYATRWYLTLFNLSVPFPAQLRIWDVFMLLGDGDVPETRPATARPATARPTTGKPKKVEGASGSVPATTASTETSNGDGTTDVTATNATSTATWNADAFPPLTAAKANLSILHATSTALIDGLQEVLLDADFENAMKAVTSWVPVKDEELLMKVVYAEWKRHEKKSRK